MTHFLSTKILNQSVLWAICCVCKIEHFEAIQPTSRSYINLKQNFVRVQKKRKKKTKKDEPQDDRLARTDTIHVDQEYENL